MTYGGKSFVQRGVKAVSADNVYLLQVHDKKTSVSMWTSYEADVWLT